MRNSNSNWAMLIQALKQQWIALVAIVLVVAVGVYYGAVATLGDLPRSGDATLHLASVVAAFCSILALLYPLVKRSRRLSGLKLVWLPIHLVAGSIAASLALAHWSLGTSLAPLLVLLAMLGLFATGIAGRVVSAQVAPLRFAARPDLFAGSIEDRAQPARLRQVVERKIEIAPLLNAATPEGELSLSIANWARSFGLAWRFQRIALQEERLIQSIRGEKASWLVLLGRYWRVVHIVLALLMVLGLTGHVITVELFADYAGGGQPYWWHIRR